MCSPAPSGVTSTSPGTKPSMSRSALGITSRPALSMVERIPLTLPFSWLDAALRLLRGAAEVLDSPTAASFFAAQVAYGAHEPRDRLDLGVQCYQFSVQPFGERDVRRVVGPHVVPELPDAREQRDMAVPLETHASEQLKGPLSFGRRQLLPAYQPAESGSAFQVNRVRCGEFPAHHDCADPFGDGIRADQELHHGRCVENDHSRASRIAVITSITSSAVTSDRAAMSRARSAASSGVVAAASLSRSWRTYAWRDWPARAARTLSVVTAPSETSRTWIVDMQ